MVEIVKEISVIKQVKAIYDHGVLRLLKRVKLKDKSEVTVVIIEDDVPSRDIAALVSAGGSFGFLAAPEEDVYSLEDGKPV